MLDTSLLGMAVAFLLVFLTGIIAVKCGLYVLQKVSIGFLIIAARLKVVINKITHNIVPITLLIIRHINSVYRVARSLKMQLTNLL